MHYKDKDIVYESIYDTIGIVGFDEITQLAELKVNEMVDGNYNHCIGLDSGHSIIEIYEMIKDLRQDRSYKISYLIKHAINTDDINEKNYCIAKLAEIHNIKKR